MGRDLLWRVERRLRTLKSCDTYFGQRKQYADGRYRCFATPTSERTGYRRKGSRLPNCWYTRQTAKRFYLRLVNSVTVSL